MTQPVTEGWTLETAVAQVELLAESMQDLQQLMTEDRGWMSLNGDEPAAMNRDDLNKAADQCRVMAAFNPLIKRGGAVRAGYVWGQGIGVTAKDEAVNDVVQEFLDDDENRSVLTGHQAHIDLEGRLYTDGNVFLALFTDPMTGRVRPRVLEFKEISSRITNPEDSSQVWFYVRKHTVAGINPTTGATSSPQTRVTYYPDLRYRPATRARFIGTGSNRGEIRWDAPVLHVHDNALTGTGWGIGDAFPALPWAKAYKGFLEDWSRLTKALSKIAWSVTSESKSKAQQARAGIAKMGDGAAGGTANLAGMKLEAVPKSGATIDAESGRPLAAMVAAALGLPVTTLMADPGQTGARAVAETLDTPTELEMTGRRELWREAMRAILNHVIDAAATAPANPALRGTARRDGDRLIVDLNGDPDRTLDITFPDLSGDDLSTTIEAVVKALDTEKIGGAAEAKLVEIILRALKVRDVDELMGKIKDADGNLIDRSATAGDAAVQAFRQGQDPAEAL